MADIDTTQINPPVFEGTIAFVATEDGLTIAQLSTNNSKEPARIRCGAVEDIDVREWLCLATFEDVFIIDQSDGTMSSMGFDSVSAVTVADGEFLAGDDNGRVAQYDDGRWRRLRPAVRAPTAPSSLRATHER